MHIFNRTRKSSKIIIAGTIECSIFGQSGRREFHQKREMDSFVKNFMLFLNAYLSNAGTVVTVDTGGSNRTISGAAWNPMNAPAANVNYGILFGTGTGANTPTTYVLGTKIAEGTSSGQLLHQATTVGTVSVSGSDSFFTVSRNAVNSSGSDITIQEVGLHYYQGSAYYILIARDLTGGHVVNTGKTYAAVYTLQITTS